MRVFRLPFAIWLLVGPSPLFYHFWGGLWSLCSLSDVYANKLHFVSKRMVALVLVYGIFLRSGFPLITCSLSAVPAIFLVAYCLAIHRGHTRLPAGPFIFFYPRCLFGGVLSY